jgi:hypothetical protein
MARRHAMSVSATRAHLRSVLLDTLSVLGIVGATVIGLHAWADAESTRFDAPESGVVAESSGGASATRAL